MGKEILLTWLLVLALTLSGCIQQRQCADEGETFSEIRDCCPGLVAVEGVCQKADSEPVKVEEPIVCSDGTEEEECSAVERHLFCDKGELVENCSECGCQPGRECKNNKCVGKVWELIASNDPDDYLGDYLYSEPGSDWKHYQPMVDRVNELTLGLTSDLGKAKAIANWVKSSRPYDQSKSCANNYDSTIIDIFDCEAGLCLDSGILTAAMLRLANIPARMVLPAFDTGHSYSEAYINGEWFGIDATFGAGEALFKENLTGLNYTRFQQPSENLFVTYKVLGARAGETRIFEIGGKEHNVENAIFFEQKIIPRDDYGFVYYPIVSERSAVKCSVDAVTGEDICGDNQLEFDEEHDLPDSFQYMLVIEERACGYYYCREASTQSEPFFAPTFAYKGFFVEYPGQDFQRVAKCSEPCWNDAWPKAYGYIKIALPAGNYTIKYFGTNSGVRREGILHTAQHSFNVEQGKTTIIKPENLTMAPEGNEKAFNVLMELLKRSTEGVEIS